jgi:hypothetical protein
MTKFLKDGAPFNPRVARTQAQAAQPQQPQRKQPNPIPTQKRTEVPGTNRRAPQAAVDAHAQIMAQRERQEAFRKAQVAGPKPGDRFIPEADAITPPKPVKRGVAINPIVNNQPVVRAPQPPVETLPPTQQVKPLAEKSGFEMDERYQEVYLPSLFLPYDFKRIHVRQLTRGEIKAIIRARASGSYRHLLQAIGQTLDVDPLQLTLGDFWYLMYWHRINSYKKSPFVVSWECKEEAHVKRTELDPEDESGKYLPKASLGNTLQINRSNIKEITIDQEKYLAAAQHLFDEYNGMQVTPSTVGDFADMMEESEEEELKKQTKQHKLGNTEPDDEDELMKLLYELQEEVADAEVKLFGYRYAALVHRVHGDTLQERDDYLDQFPPEVTDDLETFLQAAEHGVNEKFHVTCAGCGASKEIQSSLDALAFLPAYINGSDA